jgi:hypothetical protein
MEPKNITLGLGNLEFGTYTNDVFTSYSSVGAIKGTVTITINREVLKFETGRPLKTIIQEVVRESVMVNAQLAEISLATLKQALGSGNLYTGSLPTFLDGSDDAPYGDGTTTTLSAVSSGTLLKFGGLTTHNYIGLRFTHRRRDGVRIVWEFFKASPAGELSLPFQEEDYAMYEVSFELLADTCKPAGEQYFQAFIENFTATPAC